MEQTERTIFSNNGVPALQRPRTSSHLRLVGNRELQQHIKTLEAGKKRLDELNSALKKHLLLPTNRTRRFFGEVVKRATPRWLAPKLPIALLGAFAEEPDVLETIEGLLRTNVNTTQDALRGVAADAARTYEEFEELESYIKQAREEQWSARELQEFMATRAGIEIYDEVAQLLDNEFSSLPLEEREGRKEVLLAQLEANVVVGKKLMDTLNEVCSAGLQVFHRAVGQYYDYTRVYQRIAVIRDSARAMLETNHTSAASREALKVVFEESIAAIGLAIETVKIADRYAIASSETIEVFKSGQFALQKQLADLRKSAKAHLALPAPSTLEQKRIEKAEDC